MVEYNKVTKEKHLFCDRCGKEIIDNVYVLVAGDTLCEKCFKNSYELKTAEDYLSEIIIPDEETE